MPAKRSLVKVVVGASEVKRGLAGYVVLADSMVMGERTLVLERTASVQKRAHRKVGAQAAEEPRGE